MRLACSTSSFPGESLGRAIARVSWAGYRAVEVALGELRVDAVSGEDLEERLPANQLELAAIHAGVLGAGDADTALSAAGEIGRAALLAHRVRGERVIVQAPDRGSVEHLAAGLVTLLGVLVDVPVRLCVVNIAGTLVAEPAQMTDLCRRVESPRFGLALDPAEALLAGWNPAGAVPGLPLALEYVYLDDARGGKTVPPGEGEVGWPALAAALRREGFDGYLTLRLRGAEPWAAEPAARDARSLAQEWFDLRDDA
jgi:sugar phosphate isomerase/epimerase